MRRLSPGKTRQPTIPPAAAPIPPTRPMNPGEAWKSPPRPPRKFVSENVLAGAAKRMIATSTSRRLTKEMRSPKNCGKDSLARRRAWRLHEWKGDRRHEDGRSEHQRDGNWR